MNKALKKKLAYYIVSMSFNYEESSTMDMLQGVGVDVTEEEAREITDMAAEVFDSYADRSEGWEAAKTK